MRETRYGHETSRDLKEGVSDFSGDVHIKLITGLQTLKDPNYIVLYIGYIGGT